MFVCEYSFQTEDPNNKGYSLAEVDFYSWIPAPKRDEVPNHRLSLRKNLVTEEYELYRQFNETFSIQICDGIGVTHQDTQDEQEIIIKSKDLKKVLMKGHEEVCRFHECDREPDQVCEHRYPNKAIMCGFEELIKEKHLY